MAALMRIRTIFVFTHDSIGLGEDGPTHQAVEHVSSLRLIPNMHVWRPADSTETMVAWGVALQNKTQPSSLILSRQNLACQERNSQQISDISKGGYIINAENNSKDIDLIIIATGSELNLAQETKQILNAKNPNKNIRIVSMPCLELFEAQTDEYKQSVLPTELRNRTIAIEAGTTALWYKYAYKVFGIDSFGESAPANVLFKHFGLTAQSIADKI
jgi:transketolase